MICYGHYGQIDGIARHIKILIRQGVKPRQLQLPQMAKRFRMDPKILRVVFQQRYNMSLQAFVTQERLNYLQELLAGTKPVKVIALELGYKRSSNFSCDFIRMAGIGPRAWRRTLKKS
jgi:AraC family transcriptional regulator